jgi:hypothetical protein
MGGPIGDEDLDAAVNSFFRGTGDLSVSLALSP